MFGCCQRGYPLLGRKIARNIIKCRHEQIGIFSASASRSLVADVACRVSKASKCFGAKVLRRRFSAEGFAQTF